MGVKVLGVGLGLFIVLALWTVALILCVLFWKSKGLASYSGVGFSFLALLITIVLAVIPKSSESQPQVTETKVYDNFFVGRIVLVVILGIFALLTLALIIAMHFVSPVLAVPIRNIK